MSVKNVLLVEDSESESVLIKDALNACGIECSVTVVRDGESAIEYIFRRGQYTDAKPADLVMLDIMLPRMSGIDVLREIRSGDFKELPVIMITNSESRGDIIDSYDLKANSFMTKSFNLDEFYAAVKSIVHLWLSKP